MFRASVAEHGFSADGLCFAAHGKKAFGIAEAGEPIRLRHLDLPAVDLDNVAASPEKSQRGEEARPTRVLIVEDERATAFHLHQCLVRLGYIVAGVLSTGRETLQRLVELRPDIILLAIHIDGDIDGIETASQMREESALPVIYLAAHCEDATLQRARATKPYGFLLKPFSERELHATIQMALARSIEEQELGAISERFRDISRMASDWFWEQDAEHCFQWISDSLSLDGRMVEEFEYGKTRWETIDRGVTASEWEAHRVLLDRRQPIRNFQFERLDADDNIHHLSISGDPILDINGRFRGYRGIGQDITRQIQIERTLQLAKEEAESASRFKSQFLANMSHELRTPLNAILGFSEIIRDATMGPVSDRYRSYATDIFVAGRHLLRVINDVLDLSKVEAGRMELQEEWVDLSALFVACGRLIRARADEASITLEVNATADLPPVMADPSRLQQILLNLLANAVKFTPANGSVSVNAVQSAGDGIRVLVADTGIGMSPEDIPIALRPFRQLEGQLSRRYEGTGLGLPIAKMLIELHGGTLDIESQVGRGTIVCVHLPQERLMTNSP
ncbi:MAG: ATP-binding protein [Aliidongia sp.]